VAFVSLVLSGALLAPVAVLGYWALRGLANDRTTTFTTDPGDLVTPAWHTASLGLVTAVVAVVVLLPLAYLVGRYRSRVGGVASAMVVAGFAMPGLIIALSLVWWVLEFDLLQGWYQTLPVVVTAYVLHFGAQAARTAQIAVATVPRRLDDAARLLGAPWWRRLVRVDFPLMLPGLAAGMGLVLLSTMKELPATLLLSPPGYTTLATRIWSATDAGRLAQASFGALVLVALSSVLTWLLVIRAGDKAHA
jgi:iron(III) transport system permease protein